MAGDNEEQIISEEARNRANAALSSLARAASTAGMSLLGTRPDIVSVTSGMGQLGEAIKFAAANLEFMRGMSSYGVDFAFQIDEMRVAASGARMSLEKLASVVSESSQLFTLYGDTADNGLSRFLQASNEFFFNQRRIGNTVVTEATEYATRLQRLGYSTDEINDTLLTFNTLNRVAFRQEYTSATARNEAAFEFAKQLDALARMTGKQREQIQDEMTDRMRQGQSVAFERQLQVRAQDSFRQSMALVSTMPEGVGNLLQDMIIAGVPKTEETRELYAPFQEAAALAAEYGQALRRNASPAELRRLQTQMSAAVAQSLGDPNGLLSTMAPFQGVGGAVDAYAAVLGEGAYGFLTGIENLRRQMSQEQGRTVTQYEAMEEMIRRVNAAQNTRTESEEEGRETTRSLNNTLITLNDTLAITSLRLNRDFLQPMLQTLGPNGARLETALRERLSRDTDTFLNNAGNTMAVWTAAITGEAGESVQLAVDGISRALAVGDRDTADELASLTRRYLEAQQSGNNSTLAQLERDIAEVTGSITASSIPISTDLAEIIAEGDVTINPRQPTTVFGNNGESESSQSIGSLGAIGRYFRDYGTGTQVTLHNMEAVMTPRQAAEFGASIAQGSGERVASLIGNEVGSQRNSYITGINTASQIYSRNLNGMLNTIVTAMNTNTNTRAEVDLSGLETRMSELTSSFANPLRDLSRELATPLNTIAQTANQQLDVQRDHLKRVKNMSSDGNLLRGRA